MIALAAEHIAVDTAAVVAVLGMLAAGLRALVKLTKVIDGQLGAMENNTKAVNVLTSKLDPLAKIVEEHERILKDHGGRIVKLERHR